MTAFRYGGEEFTLLMPGMDLDESYRFMNKLRKQLNDTPFEGVEILPHGCLSFSAGVAAFQVDMYNKSQLVDQADKALYYAKSRERTTYIATAAMTGWSMRSISCKMSVTSNSS